MSLIAPEPAPQHPTLDADFALLRELLLSDAHASGLKPGNPRLLMLAGPPGVGKSHFARSVESGYPFLTLESDRLRKSLVSRPEYTPAEHRRVFPVLHHLLDDLLEQGFPLIFDATNMTERTRRPVYRIAQKRDLPLAVAVVTAPSRVVRRRLLDREAGLDSQSWSDAGWDIYTRMSMTWEPVKRPHIVVDTSADTSRALRLVLDWAININEPLPYSVRLEQSK